MTGQAVGYRRDGAVAVITIDDGKVNALSHSLIASIGAALDRAEADRARAVAVAGRPGCFSAGFDLAVMRAGIDAAVRLVLDGAELAIRVYDLGIPVVMAATGHAIAMGAVLLLCGDQRIGADGDFKFGLNEVAIGMELPEFALELVHERLSPRHRTRAAALGEIYSPAGAVEAGFLDRLAPDGAVIDEALRTAASLAGTLDGTAHRATKRALRAASLERLRRTVSEGQRHSGG